MNSAWRRAAARSWRGYADLRRVLTRSGHRSQLTGAFGGMSTRPLDDWHRRSYRDFDRYRDEFAPADGNIAVVCVSMRPHLVDLVADHVIRQVGVEPELVFVVNGSGFDDVDLERVFRDVSKTTLIRTDETQSLGSALNAALAATSARFIAKFDDDDRYGRHHLVDSLRAHRFAGAGVVGKHTYYARVHGLPEQLLRFPGNEFRYSSTLAGGTLVIDRERTADLAFEDVSLGEDRAFLEACHRRGISTFAADRFNFLQCRGADNTWRMPTDRFLAGCVVAPEDDVRHQLER